MAGAGKRQGELAKPSQRQTAKEQLSFPYPLAVAVAVGSLLLIPLPLPIPAVSASCFPRQLREDRRRGQTTRLS